MICLFRIRFLPYLMDFDSRRTEPLHGSATLHSVAQRWLMTLG